MTEKLAQLRQHLKATEENLEKQSASLDQLAGKAKKKEEDEKQRLEKFSNQDPAKIKTLDCSRMAGGSIFWIIHAHQYKYGNSALY